MIAYTAWDSLQAIARQYDADLVVPPGEQTQLTKRRGHPDRCATVRQLGERLRAGLAILPVQARSERHV